MTAVTEQESFRDPAIDDMDRLLSGVPFPEAYEQRPVARRERKRLPRELAPRPERRSRRWIAELVVGLSLGSLVVAVIAPAVLGGDPTYGVAARLNGPGPADSLAVVSAQDKQKRPDGEAYRALQPWKLKPGDQTYADVLLRNTGKRTIAVDLSVDPTGTKKQTAGLAGRVLEQIDGREVTLFDSRSDSIASAIPNADVGMNNIELRPGATRLITIELDLSSEIEETSLKGLSAPINVSAHEGPFHISDFVDALR